MPWKLKSFPRDWKFPRVLLFLCLPGFLGSCGKPRAGSPLGDEVAAKTAAEKPAKKLLASIDLSKHNVPLEKIYVEPADGGRAAPLNTVGKKGLLETLDSYPPILQPEFLPANQAAWVKPGDEVVGYASGDGGWAFPLNTLVLHHAVNTTFGDEPAVVTYCSLCRSAAIYSRRVKGRVLTFGNPSAIYQSNLLLIDYETATLWWQGPGRALVGTLTGTRLRRLPSTMTTWRKWLELVPKSEVLRPVRKYAKFYPRPDMEAYRKQLRSGQFVFPVDRNARDSRLRASEQVLTVTAGSETRAYPIRQLSSTVLRDRVGGKELIIFLDPEIPSGAAFLTEFEGQQLSFKAAKHGFVDLQTGSLWDLAGRAIAGAARGKRLIPVASLTEFWFAAAAAHPGIAIYRESGADSAEKAP